MALPVLPVIEAVLNNPIGSSGYGPYRLFGDSHIVTMCSDYPEIFELQWYVMRKAYNLAEHLAHVNERVLNGKINLFMAGMPTTDHRVPDVFLSSIPSVVSLACASFMNEVLRLRDRGVSAVVLSPCPTAVPNSSSEEYSNVATFLTKVGGYDTWKDVTVRMVNRLQELCAVEGVRFVDTHSYLVHPLTGDTPEALRTGDGWHLNTAAGHVVAACVHRALEVTQTELSI